MTLIMQLDQWGNLLSREFTEGALPYVSISRYMYVKCVAFQMSGDRNVFEPRSVSQEFDVLFGPIPPEQQRAYYFDVGRPAHVTVEFHANPPPDTVVWHVVGDNEHASFQIPAGNTAGDRYTAAFVDIDDTRVRATD